MKRSTSEHDFFLKVKGRDRAHSMQFNNNPLHKSDKPPEADFALLASPFTFVSDDPLTRDDPLNADLPLLVDELYDANEPISNFHGSGKLRTDGPYYVWITVWWAKNWRKKNPVLVERRSCDYELSLVEIKHPVFVPSGIDSVRNYSSRWVGVVCPCRHFFQTLWDFFFFFQKLLKQNFLSQWDFFLTLWVRWLKFGIVLSHDNFHPLKIPQNGTFFPMGFLSQRNFISTRL